MTDSTTATSYELGLIRVTGNDADHFLSAQLTNIANRGNSDHHFLAAWCDAKGRTQLLLRVAVADNAFLLILPRELIAAAIKRLRMFVLRLDVKLADVSADYDILGIHDAEQAPGADQLSRHGQQLWLGLPSSTQHSSRCLILQPTTDNASWTQGAMPADHPDWISSDIDAGIPQITAATQGEFVPQMLNLHWLQGIDFAKGCYPGQEVIARLHYRGRLTRRTFRLTWEGQTPTPGDNVVDQQGKPQGQILQASGEQTGHALAVIQVDAAVNGQLETRTASLKLLELPYSTE